MIKKLTNKLKKNIFPKIEIDLRKISPEQIVRYLTHYGNSQLYTNPEIIEFEDIVARYGVQKIFDCITIFNAHGYDASTALLTSVRRDELDSIMEILERKYEVLSNTELFERTQEVVYLKILHC